MFRAQPILALVTLTLFTCKINVTLSVSQVFVPVNWSDFYYRESGKVRGREGENRYLDSIHLTKNIRTRTYNGL